MLLFFHKHLDMILCSQCICPLWGVRKRAENTVLCVYEWKKNPTMLPQAAIISFFVLKATSFVLVLKDSKHVPKQGLWKCPKLIQWENLHLQWRRQNKLDRLLQCGVWPLTNSQSTNILSRLRPPHVIVASQRDTWRAAQLPRWVFSIFSTPVPLSPSVCWIPKRDFLLTATSEVVRTKTTGSQAWLPWQKKRPMKTLSGGGGGGTDLGADESWIISKTNAFEDVTSRGKFPTMFSARSCPVGCNYSILHAERRRRKHGGFNQHVN